MKKLFQKSKLKNLYFGGFLFIIAAVFVVSCAKNDDVTINPDFTTQKQTTTVQATSNVPVFYYFDDVEVPIGTFNPEEESSNTLIVLKLDANGEKYIEMHGFSSEEKYFLFGDTNEIPLRSRAAVEKHLGEYAVSSGAVAEYEITGIEPLWYTNYVNNYIQNHQNPTASNRSASFMYDDYNASGASFPFYTAAPTMLAGAWNNRVSSYTPLHFLGQDSFFDKSFFIKKMATIWNIGWSNYSFDEPAFKFIDKKTSSWIG